MAVAQEADGGNLELQITTTSLDRDQRRRRGHPLDPRGRRVERLRSVGLEVPKG